MSTHYQHRQSATVLHWVFAIGLLCCALPFVIARGQMSPPIATTVAAVAGMLAVIWFLFRHMDVEVNDTGVHLRMASGWPKHILPRETIASASLTKRSWLYGYGIRWSPAGWMWRVSGGGVVEVHRSTGRSFFIGTNDAQKLADAIQASVTS